MRITTESIPAHNHCRHQSMSVLLVKLKAPLHTGEQPVAMTTEPHMTLISLSESPGYVNSMGLFYDDN